jgi:CBS domain-containing protein
VGHRILATQFEGPATRRAAASTNAPPGSQRKEGGQAMATAREIMHPQAECIDENETLNAAARMMRDLHVGSLPICGADGQLRGILTDRDLVVRCIAENGDPRTVTAGQFARGTPVCADADVDVSEVLRLMEQHAIRRLPVLDDDRLVGMISEADLATHLGEHEVAEFAGTVYAAPPNS